MWMSSNGTLYITSPSDNSVKRWTGRRSEIAVQDGRLRWPDTLSADPDGNIYVTARHIQDTYWFKPAAPASVATALFRFRPAD
jgi:hypothetical protein